MGAVVAAQVAAPVLRTAGTLLFTSGGFAEDPVPALASLSMGKAALQLGGLSCVLRPVLSMILSGSPPCLAGPCTLIGVDEEAIDRVTIGLIGKVTAQDCVLQQRGPFVQAIQDAAKGNLTPANLHQIVALGAGNRERDPTGAE
jgi:hypothetical protein